MSSITYVTKETLDQMIAELNQLKSAGRSEIAKAIADAILSYKKEYFGAEANEVSDVKPSQRVVESVSKDTSKTKKYETKSEKVVTEKPLE